MKIKLVLFTMAAFMLTMSCQKIQPVEGPVKTKPNIDKSFFLTDPYKVEVREGFITEITMGEERLAFTDIPMTIDIPKVEALSRSVRAASDEIKVKFIAYKDVPDFVKGTGISEKTHVLMFEDSRKGGDFDYNDFVVVVKHSLKTTQIDRLTYNYAYDFTVKPIALGSTFKSLKFGYIDENDGKEVYFTNDVRADYFNGSTGMVNTSRGIAFKMPIENDKNISEFIEFKGKYFEQIIIERYNLTMEGTDLIGGYYKYVGRTDKELVDEATFKRDVNYFLEVNGNYKIYIAEVSDNSGSKLPYGLAIPSSLKSYPYESQNISDVYPGFENWVKNTNSNLDWYKNPNKGGVNVDFAGLYRWFPTYEIE